MALLLAVGGCGGGSDDEAAESDKEPARLTLDAPRPGAVIRMGLWDDVVPVYVEGTYGPDFIKDLVVSAGRILAPPRTGIRKRRYRVPIALPAGEHEVCVELRPHPEWSPDTEPLRECVPIEVKPHRRQAAAGRKAAARERRMERRWARLDREYPPLRYQEARRNPGAAVGSKVRFKSGAVTFRDSGRAFAVELGDGGAVWVDPAPGVRAPTSEDDISAGVLTIYGTITGETTFTIRRGSPVSRAETYTGPRVRAEHIRGYF